MRMCMRAAGIPMVRGSLCVPPAPGRRPSSASGSPIRYSPSSAIRRSQESANSKAPARAVPEMAAITGFGILAQRHGFIEESAVVGGVLGPLATGSAQGLRDLDKRRDIKMTIEITGCAASHDDNANVGVARESLQRFGERVAYLRVEVDAF